MNERFESTREQIMNIDWSNEESDKPSHAVLLFEFYRRRAVFLDHLSIETAQRRAFFSAAKESNIELPIDIGAMCPELELIKNEWLVKLTCLFSLEWAYLIDQEIPIALKFHDMYNPIIELFKRGGRVRYHHADIICGKIGRSRIRSNGQWDRSVLLLYSFFTVSRYNSSISTCIYTRAIWGYFHIQNIPYYPDLYKYV